MSISDTPKQENAASRTVKRFTSYSLNFEDVILNRLFPTETNGFYVDVGAGHPRFENDLYAFHERGWRGINVEPNKGFYLLQQEMRPYDRNLCMVLSDTEGAPLTYYEVEGSGLSTCDEAQAKEHASRGYRLRPRSVQVGTLAGILSEADARNIDVLKVDVEGFEEKVLSGNDWDRFRPSVVLVEATYPESPERRPTNIRGFMEQRGYNHVYFDGLNDFYVERGFPVPNGLTLPPNVFDYFVPREIADLREQVASLRHESESASRENADLRERMASLRHESESAGTTARALATENRQLSNRVTNLTNDSRRFRQVADQLRGEITALSSFLAPMHEMHEQLERMRRQHAEELYLLRTACQNAEAERRAVEARLHAVYLSTSWFLTKPWRAAGRLVKRLVR